MATLSHSDLRLNAERDHPSLKQPIRLPLSYKAALTLPDELLEALSSEQLVALEFTAVYHGTTADACRSESILRRRFKPRPTLLRGKPWNLQIDPTDYMGFDQCIDD
jgi:hypothetical protein